MHTIFLFINNIVKSIFCENLFMLNYFADLFHCVVNQPIFAETDAKDTIEILLIEENGLS